MSNTEQVAREFGLSSAAELEALVAGVGPAKVLAEALSHLRRILTRYQDDGDWYDCIRTAVPYLEESLRSNPPGLPGGGREVLPESTP